MLHPIVTDNTTEHSTSVTPHVTDNTTEHSTSVTPHVTHTTTEHSTSVTPHVTDNTTEHSTSVTPPVTHSTTEHSTNVTTHPTFTPLVTDTTKEPITSISPGSHPTTSTGTETSTRVVVETSTSAGGTSVTVAPDTPFYISFKITNKEFNSSLTEVRSDYYKALENQIIQGLKEIYGCNTCPTHKTYKESTVLRFSKGSVVADTKSIFMTNDISTTTVQKQFENSLINGDMLNSLQLSPDSIKVALTDATPPSSQPGSEVPGWGIALLVLAALILLILLSILILMISYCCVRRRRGQFDVFGIGGYYSMNDSAGYPMYSTHTHYEVPNGGSFPSNTNQRNGAGYTNKALETNNL
ncbi:mucin-1-like [Polyodon spathula]|uniref:mucin-1-like n=1 Tax=Polyodon spathula TaxID=7913 RepID=UPI001B7DD8A8|nr:mucin-1-like [Polyodon spathula]